MSKITLNNLSNLQNESSAVNIINNNNDVLEAAVENTISRDGTAPNTMGAELDMNNNRVINLPPPVSPTEPIRVADLEAVIIPSPLPGNVTGPSSAIGGNIAVFQGTTGKAITDSGVDIQDIEDEINLKANTNDPTFTTKITAPEVVISKSASPSAKFTDTATGHSRSIKLASDDKVYVTNTSDANVVNIDNSGNVTATAFYGNGTTLTGLETSSHATSTYSPIVRSLNGKTSAYTFSLTDSGNVVMANSSSAITFTIPTDASVAFPIGTQIDLINTNSGKLTISPSSGVTLASPLSLFSMTQSTSATLIKYGTNSWLLNGGLSS